MDSPERTGGINIYYSPRGYGAAPYQSGYGWIDLAGNDAADGSKARFIFRAGVGPTENRVRPSVDALFHSAAEVYGSRVLGIVMTGMGSDGREGAAWIKAKGGSILTETEASCVVYGMPRSVVEAGLSDESVPLERIAQAIMERV